MKFTHDIKFAAWGSLDNEQKVDEIKGYIELPMV